MEPDEWLDETSYRMHKPLLAAWPKEFRRFGERGVQVRSWIEGVSARRIHYLAVGSVDHVPFRWLKRCTTLEEVEAEIVMEKLRKLNG